jgi:hypothetical protein
MTPTEYRSVKGPSSCAIACSGAMYVGVPTVIPSLVRNELVCIVRALAMPKSATFTCP